MARMQNPTSRQNGPEGVVGPSGLSDAELAALPRVRRGPVRKPVPRAQVTLRLSQTLVDQLKATGPGWINRLEQWLEQSVRPKP
jgi:uncharacterized protein (DUF4415 family)